MERRRLEPQELKEQPKEPRGPSPQVLVPEKPVQRERLEQLPERKLPAQGLKAQPLVLPEPPQGLPLPPQPELGRHRVAF
jgi:hypothetical protein